MDTRPKLFTQDFSKTPKHALSTLMVILGSQTFIYSFWNISRRDQQLQTHLLLLLLTSDPFLRLPLSVHGRPQHASEVHIHLLCLVIQQLVNTKLQDVLQLDSNSRDNSPVRLTGVGFIECTVLPTMPSKIVLKLVYDLFSVQPFPPCLQN